MKHEQIENTAIIDGTRFSLRPLRNSDVGLIELFGSDERVARMTTSIPHPLPPGAVEAYVSRCMSAASDEDVWVIDGLAHGSSELMGLIALERLDRDQSEIGYWVAPAFWNEGIAQEAVQSLISANPQSNRTIFASVFQDNPASATVLTRVGFEYIGDAESFCVARDSSVPTWTYLRKFD